MVSADLSKASAMKAASAYMLRCPSVTHVRGVPNVTCPPTRHPRTLTAPIVVFPLPEAVSFHLGASKALLLPSRDPCQAVPVAAL